MSALSDELKQVVFDILTEFAPSDRVVYKRTISKTGSFQQIGRSVAVAYSDTLLSPQPMYRRLGRSDIAELNNKNVLIDDILIVLSVDAITKEELINKNIVLVLEDASGNEEVVRLVDYINPAVNNVEVAFIGFYRTTNRQ